MTDRSFQRVQDILQSFDETETWRPVDDWPGYFVSSWGRMRGPRGELAPAIVHGYEKVSLSNGVLKKNRLVHRMVALAFHGEPPFEGAVVAHNDGNQRNNRASNLRWASCRENQADRSRHRTRVCGSKVFGSKLNEGDIPVIRARINAGEKYPAIAASYGVSVSTVHLIAVNKTWKHAGAATWM